MSKYILNTLITRYTRTKHVKLIYQNSAFLTWIHVYIIQSLFSSPYVSFNCCHVIATFFCPLVFRSSGLWIKVIEHQSYTFPTTNLGRPGWLVFLGVAPEKVIENTQDVRLYRICISYLYIWICIFKINNMIYSSFIICFGFHFQSSSSSSVFGICFASPFICLFHICHICTKYDDFEDNHFT